MTGTAQWIPSNEPIAINDETIPATLITGSMAVFAADRQTGERLFLFSLAAGEPLWPLPCPPDAAFEIIAIPLEASYIEPSGYDAPFARENCLTKLSLALGQFRPSGESTIAEPDRSLILTQGRRITVNDGLIQVTLDSGGGLLSGAPVMPGSSIVLAPGLWLEPAGEAEWKTTAAIKSDAVASTIGQLVPAFFAALDQVKERRGEDARRRFEGRRQLNARVSSLALNNLAGVAENTKLKAVPLFTDEATGDPIFDAFNAAALSMGLKARPASGAGRRTDVIRETAQASGLRTRTVILSGAWWRQESGPLLAHMNDGDPVALIPSHRGYFIYNPARHTTQGANPHTCADLNPFAQMLYRPLPEDLSTRSLLRHVIASRRRDLRTIIVTGIGAAILAMAAPQGIAILIGQAIPDGDSVMVWQVGAGMVAAALGSAVFLLAQAIALLRVQSGAFSTLQTGVWDYLLTLSPTFFRSMTAGQLRQRADAVTRIHQLLTAEALRSLFAGAASFLSLILILYYSRGLALLALACGVLIVLHTWWNARLLYRVQEQWQESDEVLSGLVLQAINAVSKLRVAGASDRAFSRWAADYSVKQKLSLKVQVLKDRIRLFNLVAPTVVSALSFLYLLSGSIGIGPFLACSTAITIFVAALTSAGDSGAGLILAANLWQSLRSILSAKPEVDQSKVHPGRLHGGIRVESLSFRYRSDGPMILEGVSVEAEPGQCIALTGPSGSGKSTLLNLILRFETPQSGAIYLDGRDLSSLDVTAVRRQIGVVTQDGRIMAGSLFDNISAGGVNTMDEAWEAARSAGLAGDIESMPMGMHTVVSEGGGNLSGGQRQRVLIARALVLKPSILIFDEATSALDNRTQAIVTESLNRLKATRILVAHRLSTIRHADRIYVIDKGRVVQQGNFDELAATPGLFAQLVSRQSA